jgi:hypothetical protein
MHAADKTISVKDGRKFAAVLPGRRIVEVEGADHNFTGERSLPHSSKTHKGVCNVPQQPMLSNAAVCQRKSGTALPAVWHKLLLLLQMARVTCISCANHALS